MFTVVKFLLLKTAKLLLRLFFFLLLFKDGTVLVNEDCTERCTCSAGELQCAPLVCNEMAKCGVKGGVRGCQSEDVLTSVEGNKLKT